MSRRFGVVVVVMVGIALIAVWMLRGVQGAASSRARPAAAEHRAGVAAATARPRADPRTLARGSITGAVRDEAGAPIARARVCADASSWQLPDALTAAPACTDTDAQGRYRIANLIPADYTVHAAARQFHPAEFQPTPGLDRSEFPLAPGETRTGVDLVLRRGGAEITGVVLDIAGGPIARAQVRASSHSWSRRGVAVDTDDQGRFSLWVARGDLEVTASADGYAPHGEAGSAPGRFEILLIPESSLAGRVVDAATGLPVEGARVTVTADPVTPFGALDGTTDISDAEGKFRVEPIAPGRFVTAAITEHGYGRAEGSTLVGLGQHVEGVVVKLFPAHRVAGTIVNAATHQACLDGSVTLSDRAHDRVFASRAEHDGRQVADGVLPGTYDVKVWCDGYRPHDDYDPVVVAGADVTGVVWEVETGAKIRGKVVTRSGEPIDGALVWCQNVSAAREHTSDHSDRSKPDGAFALAGLSPGTYRVTVSTDRGLAPREGYAIAVAPAATVERDLVVDEGGKLTGSVVDDTGKPVANARIVAIRNNSSYAPEVNSDASGGFAIEPLRPGDYQVTARRSGEEVLHRPGTTDDARQGERVTVRAGQTATVRLVVEAPNGTIQGTVVDAAGKPVSDAFVSSARESDAAGPQRTSVASTRDDGWGRAARPVLTSTDGGFAATDLPPGKYTLRAYRKGGGEAVAEHVAVGSTVTLQIQPTASIEGVARSSTGAPPEDLAISLRDRRTGFWRSDTFYRTGGRFKVADLPAGHFQITASGDGRRKAIELDLQDAEAKTGLEIVLEPQVTVTGRLVEYGTQKPIAGMYVNALPVLGSGTTRYDDLDSISDESGRFTVRDAPLGQASISVTPKDYRTSDYQFFSIGRTIAGAGTVDIGDVAVPRRRVKFGDPVGELGLRFAASPDDIPFDQREYAIRWIDPAGPAAKTALQVGDVITSCDGIDLTGSTMWLTLSRASPGTRLTLGTRRGVTATLVLAAP